jgi:hypothetical protein
MPLQVNPQSALAGLLLGSNGVGDDGACFLAGLLQVRDSPSCDTLTAGLLQVRDSPSCDTLTAGLLQLGQCALTQLDLEANAVRHRGAKALVRALAGCVTQREWGGGWSASSAAASLSYGHGEGGAQGGARPQWGPDGGLAAAGGGGGGAGGGQARGQDGEGGEGGEDGEDGEHGGGSWGGVGGGGGGGTETDWISRGLHRRLVLRLNPALDLGEDGAVDNGGFKAALDRLHGSLAPLGGGGRCTLVL